MADANLDLWNKLKHVPPEHLKPFQRGGGFRGTAIKPMWSIHKMTEVYGPCGMGWGIKAPLFQTIQAGDEILVYCTVTVWYGTGEIIGIGGDKVLAKFKDGLKSDDEAFKKAFTDAVTNALKYIGVGADVHMGLFDGSKYVNGSDDHASTQAGVGTSASLPFIQLKEALQAVTNQGQLRAWLNSAEPLAGEMTRSEFDLLQKMIESRRAFIAQAPTEAL